MSYEAAILPDFNNLSPIDEYWIGYFRADGSLSIGTAQFGQSRPEPVYAFAEYLGLPRERVRISKVPSRSEPYFVYSLSSVGLGLLYRNNNVKDLSIDPKFFSSLHFWRGLIDGDGSVRIHKYGAPHLVFCGSHQDVTEFSLLCLRTTGFQPKVGKHGSIFQTGLSFDRAKHLTGLLYDGQYSALEYKQERAKKVAQVPWTPRWAKIKESINVKA